MFLFLQSSSYSKVPLATGPVHDGAPKSPGQLVDNDGSSSDHDEVGSADGLCLVGVRLLVSSRGLVGCVGIEEGSMSTNPTHLKGRSKGRGTVGGEQWKGKEEEWAG